MLLVRMTLHQVFCCVSLLTLFSTASSCGKVDLVSNGNGNRATRAEAGSPSDKILYYLDLDKPTILQAIDPAEKPHEAYKFVQVEVAEVTNPKKHPLSFEVRYQPKGSEEILLGTFSLYPPDNPGKFIVPTQGKLRDEGTIVLSLATLDVANNRDPIRVGVKKIKFLK
jgi:hypothetical protein